MSFHEELTDLINKYSIENESDTPDFILADYLVCCLTTYRTTVKGRDMWYGHSLWKDAVLEDAPQKPTPPSIDIRCEGCNRPSDECRCSIFYYGLMLLVGLGVAAVVVATLCG